MAKDQLVGRQGFGFEESVIERAQCLGATAKSSCPLLESDHEHKRAVSFAAA